MTTSTNTTGCLLYSMTARSYIVGCFQVCRAYLCTRHTEEQFNSKRLDVCRNSVLALKNGHRRWLNNSRRDASNRGERMTNDRRTTSD